MFLEEEEDKLMMEATTSSNVTRAINFSVITEEMDNSTNAIDCTFHAPPMTHIRFWVVTVFGSTIALISIVENLFLFLLFATRKHHRRSFSFYLMLLAFFDVVASAAYICLMSVNVLCDYTESSLLMGIWFSYMVPVLTISHTGFTASSFLIMAVATERYCVSVNSSYLSCVQKNRKIIAFLAILLGVISKGTILFEFKITYQPECAGQITQYDVMFEDFVFQTPYHTVWRFWYRNFVTIFLPFFALAYFNLRIVKTLSYAQRMSISNELAKNAKSTKRKKSTRAATRMMVLVVCTYLIANIINVLLTVFEHIDRTTLLADYPILYVFALDLSSLLAILACAFRLPIYLSCQKALRQECIYLFKHFCLMDKAYRRESMDYATDSTYIPTLTDTNNLCLTNQHALSDDSLKSNLTGILQDDTYSKPKFANGHTVSFATDNYKTPYDIRTPSEEDIWKFRMNNGIGYRSRKEDHPLLVKYDDDRDANLEELREEVMARILDFDENDETLL
uniref:G-protein coupled receptors family 1 profile domain-containing protein n=1 Tax=Acrobeloides nanus TaxID=290746 RepID=A0A914DNZ5_9BILA